MITRKPRPTSKYEILTAAACFAKEKGLRNFSRADVAKQSKVASATVSYHFGDMNALRRAVVQHAIQFRIIPILADARADRNSAELYTSMPADLKQKVAAYIAR